MIASNAANYTSTQKEAKLEPKHLSINTITKTDWFLLLVKFTSAAQNVSGNVLQLLSEEGHVGLSDVNALQHGDWRLSLWRE